jgi:MFS family permease
MGPDATGEPSGPGGPPGSLLEEGSAGTGSHRALIVHPIARALALSIGPAVGIGLARFGYAVLLPAMQADLGWSYTEAGGMNTANSFGYLAGALVTAPIARSFGVAASFRASILVAAASMALSGFTTHFWLLIALRTVAGIAGAVALIAGATLAARLVGTVGESSSGVVLGTYFGGVGVGILAMGLGLPVLLEGTPEYWAPTWIGMGAVGFLVYPMARRVSLGLAGMPVPRKGGGNEPFMRAALTPSLVSYFLFGLGYITYMTFVIAFLGERAWGAWGMSAFWILLGASTWRRGSCGHVSSWARGRAARWRSASRPSRWGRPFRSSPPVRWAWRRPRSCSGAAS